MPADELLDAVEQLNRSERGRAALTGLRKMMRADDCYLYSLDSENLAALETLCRGFRLFGVGPVVDVMRAK